MEAKTHILFISSWYPNRTQATHGLFNRHFAEAAAMHHKVSVLHISSDADLQTEREFVSSEEKNIYTLHVYYKKLKSSIPLFSQYRKRKRYLKSFDLAFKQLLNKQGMPDLIQLNVVLPAGLAVLQLHKKYRIPFVVNEGWTGYLKEDGRYKGSLMKVLTRLVLSNASFIMPVSEELQNAMIAQGLQGNYRIVPNIIKTDVFVPGNKKSHHTLKLIHVSTLDPLQKNAEGIIRAFSQALKQNSGLELLIVGEGENKVPLQKQVELALLENQVSFAGLMNETELAAAFQSSDALIMFSNFESFGVVIGEALACGLPVISSRCGGLSNQIGPELGITVETGNEEELCRAILNMAQQKTKYNAQILRQYVLDRFTTEIIGKQLQEIYKEVLHK